MHMTDRKIDSIGFDLDGTLWDGTESIAAAWQIYMPTVPEIRSIPTPDDLKKEMGLPLPQILIDLFPYLSQEKRDEVMQGIRGAESAYILEHGGILFEPLEVLKETFAKLKEKYSLYIVSNCQAGYIETFLQHYGLQEYFCDLECIGATGLSKGENIRLVMERNGFQNSIYVGDTQGDYDAACKAGVPFVLAAYGFGKVDADVEAIEKLSDLVGLMEV